MPSHKTKKTGKNRDSAHLNEDMNLRPPNKSLQRMAYSHR